MAGSCCICKVTLECGSDVAAFVASVNRTAETTGIPAYTEDADRIKRTNLYGRNSILFLHNDYNVKVLLSIIDCGLAQAFTLYIVHLSFVHQIELSVMEYFFCMAHRPLVYGRWRWQHCLSSRCVL
jgi:hypothetical protein